MGVRGLTSFLLAFYGDKFFDPINLSSTPVVIDGNNLMFTLFHECRNLNSQFGGDYSKFRAFCNRFFQGLKSSKIEAVVVMDGVRENIKFRTSLNRVKNQARNAVLRAKANQYKCEAVTLFSTDTFIQVCIENKIKVLKTNFEADEYMAKLSRDMECPVWSNDSDFFIFDVEVVPLNSIDFNFVKNSEIECKKFNRKRFMNYFGIEDDNLLFLMSSLLGNDYVPPGTFQRFFNQIPLPSKKSMNRKQKIMQGLLKWLGREPSLAPALEKIMATIPKAARPRLEKILSDSMLMYQKSRLTIMEGKACSDALSNTLETYQGNQIPNWMLEEFRGCRWPTFVFDILINRVVTFKSQIEAVNEVASSIFALDIIKSICSLILSEVESDYPISIKMFAREKSSVKSFKLNFETKSQVSLAQLRRSSLEVKEEFILSMLSFPKDSISRLNRLDSKTLKCFLPSLHFWTEKAQVTLLELRVLAFAYFLQNCDLVSTHIGPKTQEKLKRLRTLDQNSKSTLEFVHSLANLQSVLLCVTHVAILIDCHTFKFDPCNFWEGTFMFNLHEDLIGFRDPCRTDAILDFDETLVSEYNEVLKEFQELCPNVSESIKFRGKRRGRRRPKRKETDQNQSEADTQGEEEENLDSVQSYDATDLTNKFAVLSVN